MRKGYRFLGIYTTVALVLIAYLLNSVRRCCADMDEVKDTISVKVDSVRDTVFIVKIDTMPVIKTSKIVRYVPIKEIITVLDSTKLAEQGDSIVPIEQKTYTDDSTYTAYVSGIMPSLDSIIVNQRTITERVKETVTITKKRRWSVGLQGGYGYGLIYGKPDIYIGLGVSYYIF